MAEGPNYHTLTPLQVKVMELHTAGYTYRQISQECNFSYQRAQQIIKRIEMKCTFCGKIHAGREPRCTYFSPG